MLDPSELDLLSSFESLGHNCELHMVLSRAVPGTTLLQGAWVESLEALVAALNLRFHNLYAFDKLEPLFGSLALDTDYRIGFHTALTFHHITRQWTHSQEMQQRIHAREMLRIRMQVNRLIDNLSDANRIFVFKHAAGTSIEQAMMLFEALNRYGPNRLAVISEATPEFPAGSVRRVTSGLYLGAIPWFSPLNQVDQIDLPSWMDILHKLKALDQHDEFVDSTVSA